MAHPIVYVEASDYDLLVHADHCRLAPGPTRGPSTHPHGRLLNVLAYGLTTRRLCIELWRYEILQGVHGASRTRSTLSLLSALHQREGSDQAYMLVCEHKWSVLTLLLAVHQVQSSP